MNDCLFCKMIEGKIPAFKVYEDGSYFAFLDIYPRTKGHTLVIPKAHHRWVYDVPEFGAYWETVLKITKGIQRALKPEWINYFTLGEVPHAHIHILPRFEPLEESEGWPSNSMQIEKEELQALTNLISNEL
ncbi:MAG TPA: HIT domain-containing protein [Candidatus Nitrosocosmicus sp.]|nr:HIT domain-containing protein [Candidatus Nitrosocosmicus sp.]